MILGTKSQRDIAISLDERGIGFDLGSERWKSGISSYGFKEYVKRLCACVC